MLSEWATKLGSISFIGNWVDRLTGKPATVELPTSIERGVTYQGEQVEERITSMSSDDFISPDSFESTSPFASDSRETHTSVFSALSSHINLHGKNPFEPIADKEDPDGEPTPLVSVRQPVSESGTTTPEQFRQIAQAFSAQPALTIPYTQPASKEQMIKELDSIRRHIKTRYGIDPVSASREEDEFDVEVTNTSNAGSLLLPKDSTPSFISKLTSTIRSVFWGSSSDRALGEQKQAKVTVTVEPIATSFDQEGGMLSPASAPRAASSWCKSSSFWANAFCGSGRGRFTDDIDKDDRPEVAPRADP